MSEKQKITIISLLIAVLFVTVVMTRPKSHLGGCISLNLIKQQVDKSTLGTYCWTEDYGRYCIIRKEK